MLSSISDYIFYPLEKVNLFEDVTENDITEEIQSPYFGKQTPEITKISNVSSSSIKDLNTEMEEFVLVEKSLKGRTGIYRTIHNLALRVRAAAVNFFVEVIDIWWERSGKESAVDAVNGIVKDSYLSWFFKS